MMTSSPIRRGLPRMMSPYFAQTFGDLLLGQLYKLAGGDGEAEVRLHRYRATILVTGKFRPTKGDMRHVGEVLRVLAECGSDQFDVERAPQLKGTYVIRPRRKPPGGRRASAEGGE